MLLHHDFCYSFRATKTVYWSMPGVPVNEFVICPPLHILIILILDFLTTIRLSHANNKFVKPVFKVTVIDRMKDS